jgi:hypothetical protein
MEYVRQLRKAERLEANAQGYQAMTWSIDYKSGVRQDHKGRRYRIATNSRGKQDLVYVQENGAPPARTIPVADPQPRVRAPATVTTGFGSEVRRPVVFKPKRRHVIEARLRNPSYGLVQDRERNRHEGVFCWLGDASELHDLLRSSDLGETWERITPATFDHHKQYHIDEESK